MAKVKCNFCKGKGKHGSPCGGCGTVRPSRAEINREEIRREAAEDRDAFYAKMQERMDVFGMDSTGSDEVDAELERRRNGR